MGEFVETIKFLFTLIIVIIIFIYNLTMNAGIKNPMANPKLASESFKSLFTNSPTAMLLECGDGDVRDANASACELFGVTRTEIIGRKSSELIPEKPPFSSSEGHSPRNGSLLRAKESLPIRVSLHSAPIEIESGKAALISIWPTSQTQSRVSSTHSQADSFPNNELNTVQRAAEHIANFISDSMTPIQGFVSLAQNDLKKGHIRSGHLRQIAQAADRGATFARELFKFSRQKPDKVEIIAPGTVLNELQPELIQNSGNSVTLFFNTFKKTPLIGIARSDFRTIMVHAIRNATAGANGGSKIKIDCSPEANNSQQPTGSSDSFAAIRVTDNGSAIDEDISKHAFDPFFSLPGRDDPHGLCLPTIKQLMENYGGSARLISSPEVGTTLTLLFPASRH
jgi:signal transduction histidine kinase